MIGSRIFFIFRHSKIFIYFISIIEVIPNPNADSYNANNSRIKPRYPNNPNNFIELFAPLSICRFSCGGFFGRFFGRVFDFGLGDSAVCVDCELVLFNELPRFREIRGHFRRIEHADEAGTLLRNAARHNQNFLPNCLKPENFSE